MNIMDRGIGKQAILRYLDGEYQVIAQGTHVICAVTGAHIPLEDLRYWSVDHQEAYANAEVANKRYRETRKP